MQSEIHFDDYGGTPMELSGQKWNHGACLTTFQIATNNKNRQNLDYLRKRAEASKYSGAK